MPAPSDFCSCASRSPSGSSADAGARRLARAAALASWLAVAAGGVSACGPGGEAPTPPVEPFGPLGERGDLAVDSRLALPGFSAPVDAVRDALGRTHIYARNVPDALRAEGYLVARDRFVQMEILRRLAEGRMAEILGDLDESLIDTDVAFRTVGLGRVAKAQYEALAPDSELKAALDAFAEGVSLHLADVRSGKVPFPSGVIGLSPEAFTNWTAVDSLAIGRLQTYLLSYTGSDELDLQAQLDALQSTFAGSAADPELARRAGLERDLLDFTPATNATTTDGYPKLAAQVQGAPSALRPRAPASRAAKPGAAAAAAAFSQAARRAHELLAPEGFGSNNWAVSPEKSASGFALLASDPHLALTSPAVFWPVNLEVRHDEGAKNPLDMKLSGIMFPGIPAIILGHNEHVAWGATVAGYDVTDLYAEELTPDGASVLFQGTPVPLDTLTETIAIANREPLVYEVKVVPHHGPLAPVLVNHQVLPPDPAAGAISIRWTGMEATNEIAAIFGLLRSETVDEAQAALDDFGVGAQSWMLADTSGDILWTSHARVPMRDPAAFAWDPASFAGNLPCFVLPGDGSAEWNGYLADALVPWEKNPPAGFLATANQDLIGDTLDGDPSNDTLPDGTPMFLSCSYDLGFRQERIQARLAEKSTGFTPDDFASIQADHVSPMGARLTPALLAALEQGLEELDSPGTYPELASLSADAAFTTASLEAARDALLAWASAGFLASAGVDLDTGAALSAAEAAPAEERTLARSSQATALFNAWLVRLHARVLGDELGAAGLASLGTQAGALALLRLAEDDPASLATYDASALDSALWDDLGTPGTETRHERMLRALLDAFSDLEPYGGLDGVRWGLLHTVTFEALVPLFGKLTIPPSNDPVFSDGFPRHGDLFVVDTANHSLPQKLDQELRFAFTTGPTQRFVVELFPEGPRSSNALPGGAVWDIKSPHHRDLAELWRRNESAPVPFLLPDVIESAESRTVLHAPTE